MPSPPQIENPAARPADGHPDRHRFTGAAIMLAAALVFALMGMLIKLLGPGFRVWDIAAFRFGGGMALILLIFGRQINLFAPVRPKLMLTRGIVGSMAFLAGGRIDLSQRHRLQPAIGRIRRPKRQG